MRIKVRKIGQELIVPNKFPFLKTVSRSTSLTTPLFHSNETTPSMINSFDVIKSDEG